MVSIVQGEFEVEIGEFAEMAVCQTDGFLFRDMPTVTLVAQTIEEIVPVACLQTFFALGLFQRFPEVELHLQVDGRRVLLHGKEGRSFCRIFAFLVFALFLGGQCHFYGQRLYVFQSFGSEESVRIMRHEESASRIASACIYFGIEQCFVFAACQGVHSVVISFEGGEVDGSQRVQFGT